MPREHMPDEVASREEFAPLVMHASPDIQPRTTASGTAAVVPVETNTFSPAKDFRRLAGLGSSLLFVAALTMAALVAILILF